MNVALAEKQRDLSDVRAPNLIAGRNSADLFNTSARTAGQGRVLLVDDSESVRETLADLLEADGFAVEQAADAVEALSVIRRAPVFDVLVTDLSMPGADGITLIQQAREITRDLPAILLTGYADQVTSVAVIAGGNVHVLRKPVEADRLVNQIGVLMQRPRQT